jgi:hypothetical protein
MIPVELNVDNEEKNIVQLWSLCFINKMQIEGLGFVTAIYHA